ncbi:hypothetical protein PPERSA_11475 [Pseudocohnilembus persalinus]|uniref:Transmembrane protein n=1 Tax=Pseudocohnilembus persalinus TaxID=266149 RepID=A0A0V0QX78_PSEPJ|nr:hypothetical protein PPERSA_11475 [Pseudocohnilembus persalinus]|eukprot:KRX06830.1 hypothetical protein PPERSA_11475 [Pseudocohnilembus persalinus]
MDVQFKIMQDVNTLASFYKTAQANELVLNFYNYDTSIYTDEFKISDAMILIFSATQNIGSGEFGSLEETGTYNSYLQDYHFIRYNAIFPIREEAGLNSAQFVDLYNGYVDQLIVLDITIRVIIMVVVISFIILIPIVWKIERHNQKIVIIFSHIKNVDINKFLRNIVRYEKKHLIELKPSVILQKIKEQELKEYQEQLQYLNGPDQLEKLNSNNFNNQYKIKVSNNQNINTPNLQALNNTNQLNQTNLSANISIRQNLLEDNKVIKDVDDIIMKNDIKVDLDEGENKQKIENKNENGSESENEKENENENEEDSLESQDETVDNKKKNDSKKISNKSSTNKNNPKLQQKNQKNLQEIDEMEEENYVESKNDKLQAQIKINKFSLIWKFVFFLSISLGYLIFDFFNSDNYISKIQYSLDHLKYLSQRPNGLLLLFAFLQREIDESKEQIYLGENMIDRFTEKIYEIENNLQSSITKDNFPNSFQQYIDNFKDFQNGKICEMDIDINEFDLNDYKVGDKNFQEVCEELLGSVLNKGIKAAILQIIETTRSYQSDYFDELDDLDKNSATYDDDLLDLQKEYTFKTQFRQLEALIYLIYPILNFLVNSYETSFQDFITSNSNTLKMYFIFLIIYQLVVYFLLWIPFWVTLRNKLMNSKRMVSIIPVSCIIDPKNKDLKEALVEGDIISKFRM